MCLDYDSLPGAVAHQYDYGISLIILDDGRITLFTNEGDMSREAVDHWWEIYTAMVRSWPADRPVLLIHNITHPNMVFTPYIRWMSTQARELLLQEDRSAYIATVITDSFNLRLASMLSNQLSHPKAYYQERIFHSNQAALDWLRLFLKDEPA